jgi:hypothetical protein
MSKPWAVSFCAAGGIVLDATVALVVVVVVCGVVLVWVCRLLNSKRHFTGNRNIGAQRRIN